MPTIVQKHNIPDSFNQPELFLGYSGSDVPFTYTLSVSDSAQGSLIYRVDLSALEALSEKLCQGSEDPDFTNLNLMTVELVNNEPKVMADSTQATHMRDFWSAYDPKTLKLQLKSLHDLP